MARDTKNINIAIPYECWKKLKMLSIHKECSLVEIVRDILERSIANKKIVTEIVDVN